MARVPLFIVTLLWFIPGPALADAIDVEDLRPGLVATYRDGSPNQVVRLEPAIALALKVGEAPHPRLLPRQGTARWEGYVYVARPGLYRFSANLQGRFRLSVAGKELLNAEVEGEAGALKLGPEARLEAGVHALTAEFTQRGAGARLELFWQAPHFRPEPLPAHALGHLPAGAAALKPALERGRFLVEEHTCMGCHQPGDDQRVVRALLPRTGPDLSAVGRRVQAAWLYQWLGSPQKMRPGAAMPQMFGDDEGGQVERFAVTRYLVSLGGPLAPSAPSPSAPQAQASWSRGQRLFTRTGCIACHIPPEARAQRPPVEAAVNGLLPPAHRFTIDGLGGKTTAERLAEYLANPLAVDPSGRMPNMLLQAGEATDLARYLCDLPTVVPRLPAEPDQKQRMAAFQRVDGRADELKEFQGLPADKQWLDLGKRLVIDRGCNNCHTIAPEGQPFANQVADTAFEDLHSPGKPPKGCLAEAPGKRGKAPWFGFSAGDRNALRVFLAEGTKGAGSPAPGYAARTALERFNCLACHVRDGAGGLSPELVKELRRYDSVEDAEALTPPPLTGVGHKLRTPWVKEVLTKGGRARPWMGLRMPQYGEANIGKLPEMLAVLEGTEPDARVHEVPRTPARVEAGRHLVGKNGLGCIACHDIAGKPSAGHRGPDLASMNQRVRYDWYRRWLQDAQRIQPGTGMPTVFPDGKALLTEVLGGSADAQAEAMWAYLSKK